GTLVMDTDSGTQNQNVNVSLEYDEIGDPADLLVTRTTASGRRTQKIFDFGNIHSLVIEGSAGRDVISIAPDVTERLNIQYITVYARNGDDTVDFGSIDASRSHLLRTMVWAGDGNDTVRGTFAQDVIHGDAGNDNITTVGGNDLVYGD